MLRHTAKGIQTRTSFSPVPHHYNFTEAVRKKAREEYPQAPIRGQGWLIAIAPKLSPPN